MFSKTHLYNNDINDFEVKLFKIPSVLLQATFMK